MKECVKDTNTSKWKKCQSMASANENEELSIQIIRNDCNDTE